MRFFFYGTLTAQSDNAVARRLHGLLKPGIAATTPGRLYAIETRLGWYPGLIPDASGDPVHGFLHETTARFGREDLAALDRYENFDPMRPEISEFVRRELIATVGSDGLSAQTYVLREPPVECIVAVPSGRFRKFIKERGLVAFGE